MLRNIYYIKIKIPGCLIVKSAWLLLLAWALIDTGHIQTPSLILTFGVARKSALLRCGYGNCYQIGDKLLSKPVITNLSTYIYEAWKHWIIISCVKIDKVGPDKTRSSISWYCIEHYTNGSRTLDQTNRRTSHTLPSGRATCVCYKYVEENRPC